MNNLTNERQFKMINELGFYSFYRCPQWALLSRNFIKFKWLALAK